MSDDVVTNLKKPSAWFRVLFMAGFAIALYVSGIILLVLMLAQIVFTLLTGEDNSNLRRLGAGLTRYVTQILTFLTYNSEQKPFPFSEFPAEPDTPDSDARGPVVTDPHVTESTAANSGVEETVDTAPGNSPAENTEPDSQTADAEQNETQSPASGSSEEAQAVADDDGFRNPPSGTDTPQADSAKSGRGTGRRKKSNDSEAPPTDD